ncbi:hypothetical protein OHS58_17970 [Amycolatopsis sp. NBC_00348]|uniref:hypothetical protein n=1 Tax=Amycolatopsis sp. NBC_00348 TaxID=2975956 RepID=UPI002E25F38E
MSTRGQSFLAAEDHHHPDVLWARAKDARRPALSALVILAVVPADAATTWATAGAVTGLGLLWMACRTLRRAAAKVDVALEDEQRAIAACLDELADACGGPYGEWGTLEQDEQVAVIGHFSTLQPSRIHLPAVAFEYYDGIGEGNLRPFTADLRKGRAPDAWKLAPV